MAVLFISSGCTKMFREELNEIHTEIDDIKNRLDSLSNAVNTNIGNLQSILEALQDKGIRKRCYSYRRCGGSYRLRNRVY